MTEQMLTELLVFLGLMALLGTVAKVTLALVNRRGRDQRSSSVTNEHLADQIGQLRISLDATAIEIERLGEGQRFVAKVLAERSVAPEAPRPLGRVVTPH